MISEFDKRAAIAGVADERKAASLFHAGDYVAVISHHWERRVVAKKQIDRVYTNGNFILKETRAEGYKPQQWRPRWDGKTAEMAGERHGYHNDHLEPWSPAIEAEIAGRRAARLFEQRVSRLIEHLQARAKAKTLLPEHVERIEFTLGLDPIQMVQSTGEVD